MAHSSLSARLVFNSTSNDPRNDANLSTSDSELPPRSIRDPGPVELVERAEASLSLARQLLAALPERSMTNESLDAYHVTLVHGLILEAIDVLNDMARR
jgi:hypothetical protein